MYLVPDFQNPAGATLSLEKRRRVVELAEEYGFWVIEDIPYRKLRYEGEDLPLLREISAEKVVTISSFSKLLSPGIRVGFAIGPETMISALTRLGEYTYLSPSSQPRPPSPSTSTAAGWSRTSRASKNCTARA